MRFVDEVVLFDFADIPMVGSLGTGYAIGLTGEGAAVCERLEKEDVPEEDIAAVDPALLEHLVKGGFFETAKTDRRVLSAYLHVTQRCNLHCAGCTRSTNSATRFPTRRFRLSSTPSTNWPRRGSCGSSCPAESRFCGRISA